MFIEIKGVEFVNKGSELMLCAILQKVGERIPHTRFVLAPGTTKPYEKRAKLGLYQKIWFSILHIPIGMYIGKYIPKKAREAFGLVNNDEINIVLDASGFSYSDQWGSKSTVLMAKAVKKWKKNDTKVILLPQAMGPFTFKKTRNAFAQIAEKADLIFPRDNVSYKHVTDLVGKQKHIIQAPDFTNLVKGVVPASYEKQENSFCIIPNYRMIDRTPPKESQKYIPFLVSCVNYLLKKGINPFILILEGENDFWIGNEISKKSNQPLKIIREIDPLGIKGIIGACNGVISSRYHGLVSALSQGVPALAIGWSHKYETLFSEYGFPKGCLNVNASNSEIIERIDLISEKTQVAKLIQQLSEAAYFQLQKSEMMWVRVFECLGLR